jgi:outer membrane lipoprotein-sorting protein
MSTTRSWDRAGSPPVRSDGRLRPQLATLPSGLPSVETLFTFARDAELRFDTLRMRIEERAWTASGEHLTRIETVLQHPGRAKVTTTDPSQPAAEAYEVWVSDGQRVQSYSARHRKATDRPVRRAPAGLDDRDLPGMAAVYRARTALPRETLPEAFIHPAGFCQNVLATGRCRIAGSSEVGGRETVTLDCDHPRTANVAADSPAHDLRVSFDRETGVILRLVESLGGGVTRDATVVEFTPDGMLPATAFDFESPAGAARIY